jgi:hypothetical protein
MRDAPNQPLHLADEIRGPMKQRTLWPVPEGPAVAVIVPDGIMKLGPVCAILQFHNLRPV